jgi:hypothetical protein
MATALKSSADELREAPRASLYLAASLYCDGISVPVKIRNLSTTGALLELSAPVTTGWLVQLVRGSLIAHGLVAWSEGNRCGLKLNGVIEVDRWRLAPANAEQQRVDDIVRTVKAGALPLASFAQSQIQGFHDDRPLSADLKLAASLLEQLGEQLAGDDRIVGTHGEALQNLDIAMQVVRAVEAMLNGQGDLAADTHKIMSLRKSADQALRNGIWPRPIAGAKS